MKKKTILAGIATIAASLLLSGCGGPTGKVPGDSEVKKYVKENISEECELVSKELVKESPKEIAYNYKSKKRDLEFRVYAFRQNVGMYELKIYEPAIRTNYEYCIKQYYANDIKAVLDKYKNGDSSSYLLLSSIDQLDDMVDALIKVNDIYAQERNYNSQTYLDQHPYDIIYVDAVIAPDSKESRRILYQFKVDGRSRSASEIKQDIISAIAQGIKDGVVSSEAYPGLEEATEDKHVSQLDHIYFNDEEMLYDNNQNDYGTVGVMTDRFAYSVYNYDEGSYMMFVDFGLVADKIGSPAYVIREYTDRLGGSFEILTTDQTAKDLDLESTWTIGEHKYVMTCHFSELEVTDLKVTCDGEDLHIGNNHRPENDFRVTMVTLEDFCKMLDLNYRIDEESGSLYLYSN